MLQAHTVHSNERWICHPSISSRVFGPAEYLNDLPKQLTKPQTTMRLSHDTNNRSTLDAQPSSSQTGSFQATQSRCESSFPNLKEQSLSQKFAIWFDCTFADWSAELRQKAIQASWEATTCILFQAPCSPKEPTSKPKQCRHEVSQRRQPTKMGYKPETQDIHYLRE